MSASISVVIISKNERGLAQTLEGLDRQVTEVPLEIVVVDASDRQLDHLAEAYPDVRWIPFAPTSAKRITIPEQRNVGVRAASGSVIAFIDAGCVPSDDWIVELTAPLLASTETVTVGVTNNAGRGALYRPLTGNAPVSYVDEAPTINLGFLRSAFDEVGGFDDSFDYGSDIDFTWRLRDRGHRLRLVESAVMSHDWGTRRRQLKRAYVYGAARARLYHKHPRRLRTGVKRDPILFAYPLFILGLPLTLSRRLRWYPLLALVPMWRARHQQPFLTLADHLVYGFGALAYVGRRLTGRR